MPSRKAEKPAASKPAASPNRVVLWFEEGKSNKVWIGERDGCTWRARWGKRTEENRSEKVYTLPTEEKATAAFLKAVAAKQREGYLTAPATKAAAELVWQRIGLAFDDRGGRLCVTKVAKHADEEIFENTGFRAGDILDQAQLEWAAFPIWVSVIEEVAIGLLPPDDRSKSFFVRVSRTNEQGSSGHATTIRTTYASGS